MWKTVETKAEKVRIAETKRRGGQRGSRKEVRKRSREKTEKKKAEKGEDDKSEESSRRIEDLE